MDRVELSGCKITVSSILLYKAVLITESMYATTNVKSERGTERGDTIKAKGITRK